MSLWVELIHSWACCSCNRYFCQVCIWWEFKLWAMSVWDHVQLVEDSGTQFFLLFPDCFSIFNVFIAVHGELYTPVSCTRWTSYTGVSLFPNCVPNLKNIYLSCLARTLDNFLAKAVKFSSVLSVFGSKVSLHTICMAAIFLHICDWAGVWVSSIQLFLLLKIPEIFWIGDLPPNISWRASSTSHWILLQLLAH